MRRRGIDSVVFLWQNWWHVCGKKIKRDLKSGKILRNVPEKVATQPFVNEAHKEAIGNALEESFDPVGVIQQRKILQVIDNVWGSFKSGYKLFCGELTASLEDISSPFNGGLIY